MKIQSLIIHQRPKLVQPYMVMGFEGWPDAGKVSSGVVGYLRDKLQARKFAEIKPDDFTGMEPELGRNEIAEELARKGKLRQ